MKIWAQFTAGIGLALSVAFSGIYALYLHASGDPEPTASTLTVTPQTITTLPPQSLQHTGVAASSSLAAPVQPEFSSAASKIVQTPTSSMNQSARLNALAFELDKETNDPSFQTNTNYHLTFLNAYKRAQAQGFNPTEIDQIFQYAYREDAYDTITQAFRIKEGGLYLGVREFEDKTLDQNGQCALQKNLRDYLNYMDHFYPTLAAEKFKHDPDGLKFVQDKAKNSIQKYRTAFQNLGAALNNNCQTLTPS